MSQIGDQLGKSVQKISSGYRINTAADDPAGLVLSEKLRAGIVGMDQALANTQDSISMVQTAEGALSEIHSLLGSMRGLALHAANTATITSDAIAADQEQLDSAIESINRIATTTAYAGKKLIDGTAGMQAQIKRPDKASSIQIGDVPETLEGKETYIHVTVTSAAAATATTGASMTLSISGGASLGSAGVVATGASLDLVIQDVIITGVTGAMQIDSAVAHIKTQISAVSADIRVDTTGAANLAKVIVWHMTPGANTITVVDSMDLIISANNHVTDTGTAPVDGRATRATIGVGLSYAGSAAMALRSAGLLSTTEGDTTLLNINGTEVELKATDTMGQALDKLNDALAAAGSDVRAYFDFSAPSASIHLEQLNYGDGYSIDLYDPDHIITADGSDETQCVYGEDIIGTLSYSGACESACGDITGVTGDGLTLKADATTEFNGLSITMTEEGNVKGTLYNVGRIYGGALTFQIGGNAGETYKATIASMEADELGTDTHASGLDALKSGGAHDLATDADSAISLIEEAISDVSTQRAKLGSLQANVLESNYRNLGIARENAQASESRIRDVDMAKEMMEFTKNQVLTQAATAMLAQANALPNTVLTLIR